MRLVQKLFNLVGWVHQKSRADLAVDLGTANTLIHVKGQGIVVNEPSVVAIDTRTKRAVAVGWQAREFLGRAPQHVQAQRPLKDGVIADFDAATFMIKGLLEKALSSRRLLNPRVLVAVPVGITQVEKRAVIDSVHDAGCHRVFLIQEPMAAAIGAGLDVQRPAGNLVVDIGGGTTEVALLSYNAVTHYQSIRVAGDEMDEAIVRYLNRRMRIEVTPSLAEEIKIKIGCATPLAADPSMAVTGKDVTRGGPHTVTVKGSFISEALEEPVDAILDAIRRVLEIMPSALLADVQERGILLSGGGALLTGVDMLITQMIGIPTHVARDPLTSVVRGCALCMEDLDHSQKLFIGM